MKSESAVKSYAELAHSVRLLADELWASGLKDISTSMHDLARAVEAMLETSA